jgi:Ferritin-like
MILLKPQLLADLDVGGEHAVTTALERALELEHSTIPPYLYALYSLDENKNGAIADIIQAIVIEEMLHMTLVCIFSMLSAGAR